ncbi:MAG: HD-GYP domain-containing protein [Lachnospiraceae bacterium]|nr:HD-GYP domain-containing protein [Lachnospiraceae bacterium]
MSGKTERKRNYTGYITLIVVYLLTTVLVIIAARSRNEMIINGRTLPISALAGVLSSINNICLIFLVVYYNRFGYITALVILVVQFPIYIRSIMSAPVLTSLPGFFGMLLTFIAITMIYRRNKTIEDYRTIEVNHLRKQQKNSRRLFEQTATALVNAIDAKDRYSHGHSVRVAEYSEMIAIELGKNSEESRKVFYAALLHDVGKIGIPNSIINKKGKLTKEEYEVIKEHTVKGNAILSSISEYPYLSIGAHYHHERYDGKGYPDGLKGEDIPEIARIISVADAYDAMSSNRSYRDAIPQQLIREEIVKGAGTQFDPKIAKIMQHLIDDDTNYRMRENISAGEFSGINGLIFGRYRSEVSDGIQIDGNITKIRLVEEPEGSENGRGAQIVLFDSLDGRFHDDIDTVKDLLYCEYCEIWLDGSVINKGSRKIETSITGQDLTDDNVPDEQDRIANYYIEAVKVKDHVLIKIRKEDLVTQITIALPDSSRYVYAGLTGEYCRIRNVMIEKEDAPVANDYIPRIAEEISYIDVPAGDIPNVQVDGIRTQSSEGIELAGELKVSFHTMSLPTARLVWHCPYFVIYSSDDGKVNGSNYREYSLVRLDGENRDYEDISENRLVVTKRPDFEGWDVWKEKNKAGIDVTANFITSNGVVAMSTDNLGISVRNTTIVAGEPKKLYMALTGDQCAITNIRINR